MVFLRKNIYMNRFIGKKISRKNLYRFTKIRTVFNFDKNL